MHVVITIHQEYCRRKNISPQSRLVPMVVTTAQHFLAKISRRENVLQKCGTH